MKIGAVNKQEVKVLFPIQNVKHHERETRYRGSIILHQLSTKCFALLTIALRNSYGRYASQTRDDYKAESTEQYGLALRK